MTRRAARGDRVPSTAVRPSVAIAMERSIASIACRHSPRIRSARPSQNHA